MLRAAQNADHAEVERRALQGNAGAAVFTNGADFASERDLYRENRFRIRSLEVSLDCRFIVKNAIRVNHFNSSQGGS